MPSVLGLTFFFRNLSQHSIVQVMRHLQHIVFLAAIALVMPVQARHFEIGAPIVSPPWGTADLLRKSVEHLRWKLPAHTFTLKWTDVQSLESDLYEGKLDLAVLPSGPLNPSGTSVGRILASVQSAHAENPDECSACLILLRKGQSIDSVRAPRIGANSPLSVSGYLACAQELMKTGASIETIEKSTTFFGDLGTHRILRALTQKSIDIAFIRAGYAEDTTRANGRKILERFDIYRPKKDSLELVHSSSLFPAPTLVSGKSVSSKDLHSILHALLSMPVNGYGERWTIPCSNTNVNQLTKDLRIGSYEYLRHWTVERIWKEYWPLVILFVCAIAGMFIYGRTLEKLVQVRTRDLKKALSEQQKAQDMALTKSDELKRVESRFVATQLSMIFAHDISAPLSTLQNLSHGMRREIDNKLESEKTPTPEDLESLDSQLIKLEGVLKKVTNIVDKVRTYARGESRSKSCRIDQIFDSVVKDYSLKLRGRVLIELENRNRTPFEIQADALEIELMISNLIKNAAEACQQVSEPVVKCAFETTEKGCNITVSDNGPQITEAQWTNLNSRSRKSTKTDGLGLGLGIVCSIVEKHNGSIRFERVTSGGLVVSVFLPEKSEP